MDKPTGQTELRILLLEDEPTDAELVESALREAGLSFTAKRVDTREAFVRALEEFKPDIVLADYKLPTFDGGSAVKIVRQQYPAIPVVMVTGAVGDEMAVELLRLGARDYVLKDRLARLGIAVRRALSEEQNIRARKAAEEALRRSEMDIRALVEYTPIAMVVDAGVEPDEKFIMVNLKFTELFGYTMEDVPDVRHWWPLAYPDEKYREELRSEWTKRVEKAVQSHGEIEPMEATVTCKDGSHRYVKASLVSTGSRSIITLEDLTERKAVEQALRKIEKNYRSLFDNMLNGIAHVRVIFQGEIPLDMEYLSVNKGFESVTGMKEVVGRKISEIIPGYCHDNPESLEVFGRVARTGEPARWEHYLAALDRWFSFSVFSPAQGEIVIVSENITERKRAESRLDEQLNELRRWQEATLGREMRVLELKHEVNELLAQTGLPPRYLSAEADDGRHPDV